MVRNGLTHKLDFGCGDASCSELSPDRTRYYNWLSENKAFGVYGIDIDPEKVADVQIKLDGSGARVFMADGHETPFPDEFFDVIHVSHALHHMDYKRALPEIYRIAKDGCDLYFQEAVDNDPILRLERHILRDWRGDKVESYFTSDELLNEIGQYFDVQETEYHWRFYPSDWLRYFRKEPEISLRFNLWANKFIKNKKRWCAHFVVKAVK